jgi:hypothetical protein
VLRAKSGHTREDIEDQEAYTPFTRVEANAHPYLLIRRMVNSLSRIDEASFSEEDSAFALGRPRDQPHLGSAPGSEVPCGPCAACGTAPRSGAIFCDQCGVKLVSSRSRSPPRQRDVVILVQMYMSTPAPTNPQAAEEDA